MNTYKRAYTWGVSLILVERIGQENLASGKLRRGSFKTVSAPFGQGASAD